MTEEEKRAIWKERANGAKTDELARRHGITEHEVLKILAEAPKYYYRMHNYASRMSDAAFDAYPPKKRHDAY